ncbi:MAG TPA: hypothetical protein VFI99_14505 [Nocardioides sp.]|jgi:hypothetical protein|nr:hypothetical protein [Nocardioides sp.]
MAPQRTRREIAAALRRSPAPAPVDEAFIAALAELASTSTAARPSRTFQSRLGLRVAAAVSALGMITAGSAYAAHQLGQDPAPAPVAPVTETHPPEGGADGSNDAPGPSHTDAGDRAQRQGSWTDRQHPAHDGDDGVAVSDRDETQYGSAGNTADDDSSGPKSSPGQDDQGDAGQDAPKADDQSDNADDQDENQDNADDNTGDQDDNQSDNTDDQGDGVPEAGADQDQDQVQRSGGERDPDDAEVTGNDDES